MCSLTNFPQIIFTHSFDYPVLFFLHPITLRDLPFSFFSLQIFMLYFSQNNCLRYQISTYLITFPWQYGFNTLQIIILAPLTPFTTHRLATPPFPVSHDLPSGNDIGFHTIGLLLSSIHGSNFMRGVISKLVCHSKFWRIIPKSSTYLNHCILYFFMSH